MTTDAPAPAPAHAMFTVLAALAELGEATAADVADKAGLAYSTATAKLRALHHTGQAEPVRTEDKRAVWQLTDAGRTTVGADHSPPPASDTNVPPEAPAPTTPDHSTDDADATHEERTAPQPEDPIPTAQSASARTPAAPDDTVDGSEAATDADSAHPVAASADADTDAPAGEAGTATAGSRRTKGSLRGAVLDILEAHPERAYKTSELCRLIDAANAGTDARKASAGAVVNAADKLVSDGKAVRTVEKPATFQLAPPAR
ncbi:MarR family transcriptional regulator [Micromonospora sp. 15K316]|uniref:MarR family winged helix-turn-helix transcriptional regulator n=1 Tax=Micromonospora sp. 15K316 TaxID=2530376 RepID=UPI0010453DFD|nr:MarR family winged helix-turn-helix transcriptional regulator [Micromonospora sp. 15K316]TDC35133.1 MarR family transcriptional regulator [Micromonospora sp. 15K316]